MTRYNKGMTTYIILNGGYGIGWSSYGCSGKEAPFAARYEPLIEALLEYQSIDNEATKAELLGFSRDGRGYIIPTRGGVMEQYVQDFSREFGREPFISDADGLYAYDLGKDCLAKIDNHDGHETVGRIFDTNEIV